MARDISEPDVLVYEDSFEYEGMRAYVARVESTGFDRVRKYGSIELDPQNQHAVSVFIAEHCLRKGEHTPDPRDVLFTLVSVLKSHGWVPPSELPEIIITPIPTTAPSPTPTVTPFVVAQIDSVDGVDSFNTEEPSVEGAAADETDTITTAQTTQIIGAAAVGAFVGTAAGNAAAGAVTSRRKTAAGMVASPVDGKPVTASQAAWEKAQLDSGMVYDAASDSFKWSDTPEMYLGPSYLAQEVEAARADLKANPSEEVRKLNQMIKEAHQELVDAYYEEMDIHQREHRIQVERAEKMDKYSKIAQKVEYVADKSMDVCSKLAGPAGKPIKKGYDLVKKTIKHSDTIKEHGIVKGVVKVATEEATEYVKGKFQENVPVIKTGNEFVDSMANKQIKKDLDTAVDEGLKPVMNIPKRAVGLEEDNVTTLNDLVLGPKP
jgi:hypothetical protein